MSGGGRRGERSYGAGGRDAPPRRDGRGGRGGGGRYGDRDKNRGGDRGAQPKPTPAPAAPAPKPMEPGVPAPVSNVPAPKGVWGGQSFAAAAAAPAAPTATEPQASVPEPAQQQELLPQVEPEDEVQIDLGGPTANIISSEDPTPSGIAAPLAPPAVSSGNVWGSKGGAHLIQTIKTPIPAPAPVVPEIVDELEPEPIEPEEEQLHVVEEPPMPEPEPEPVADPEQPLVKESTFGVGLDSVLPPSVNGANINASGWEPILDDPSQQPSVDISQPLPVGPISVGTTPSMPVPEPVSLPQPVESTPPVVAPLAPAAKVKPSSVLNMGHWEQDGDDDALDFGFGSFAPETDNEPAAAASAPVALATEPLSSTAGAPHASPARPPPGLSMPPMPANAMLVHELEGKLENTTLGSNSVSEKTAATAQSSASSSQPQSFNTVNELTGQMNPPGMSQYGAMGMYGIAPPGVPGIGSMPPGQFPLGGNTQQQQPTSQQSDSRPGSSPNLNQASQQQPVPYGMQQTTSSATNNNSANDSSTPSAAPNTNAGMPPGMPSMYQQPNPAYLYPPGQFNQMGHPAYGMQAAAYGAYGAGGQFGHPPQGPGGPQFGYGAHQGGGSGYGAPSHYDERGQGGQGGRGGGNTRDSHGGRGGRGGYRGNRNHHQQNQYGNQGGYGGNPGGYGGYGAMYGGGYGNPGPSGMDHYGGMQQQQQQQQQGGYGGFSHQDNPNKKSSGPGGQQGGFQQQSHLAHQQQPLPLQGTSTDTASGSGGWPGSRQQNWGGNWQQES